MSVFARFFNRLNKPAKNFLKDGRKTDFEGPLSHILCTVMFCLRVSAIGN